MMPILVSSLRRERRRVEQKIRRTGTQFSGPLAGLQVSAAARTLGGARASGFARPLLAARRARRTAAARGQQSAGPGRRARARAGRRQLRSSSERRVQFSVRRVI